MQGLLTCRTSGAARDVLEYNPPTCNSTSAIPVQITFTLNGDPVDVELKTSDRLLIDVLREDLRLTGTKHGCGIGACGICTVMMNGAPVASCLQLAALCDGADIRTVEGLASPAALHAVQRAFVNRSALQCGICIPGHVIAACALLSKNPQPSDDEILASVDSVYCRCTGYVRIVEAYREAVALMRKADAA
jgi:aerobic-type carbon monoxide dehydrogenase small subunit (CoxS/CutS family)